MSSTTDPTTCLPDGHPDAPGLPAIVFSVTGDVYHSVESWNLLTGGYIAACGYEPKRFVIASHEFGHRLNRHYGNRTYRPCPRCYGRIL